MPLISCVHACLHYTELTPRLVSEAFYNGEVESEVRTLLSDMKLTLDECIVHTDDDREAIMDRIESIRSNSIYPHSQCNTDCRERGTFK